MLSWFSSRIAGVECECLCWCFQVQCELSAALYRRWSSLVVCVLIFNRQVPFFSRGYHHIMLKVAVLYDIVCVPAQFVLDHRTHKALGCKTKNLILMILNFIIPDFKVIEENFKTYRMASITFWSQIIEGSNQITNSSNFTNFVYGKLLSVMLANTLLLPYIGRGKSWVVKVKMCLIQMNVFGRITEQKNGSVDLILNICKCFHIPG